MKFHRPWTLLVALLSFTSCQCASKVSDSSIVQSLGLGEGKNSFALIYSTSVHGYVEPCGCTSQPLGGISRLASVVQTVREHYSLGALFIDGGDLLFDSASAKNPADLCQETARVDLLLGSLKDLNLLGTIKGPFDDAMGAEFRTARLTQFAIPDLTAKVHEGILEGTKGFRLGIVLLDERTGKDLDTKASALLAKGADAIVAISRLSRSQTREVAKRFQTVNLIILAAVSEESPSSTESIGPNGPFMVSAAKQGQYVGVVAFHKSKMSARGKWQLDDRKLQKETRTALLLQRKKILLTQIDQTGDENRLTFLRGRVSEIENELRELSQRKVQAFSGNIIEANTIALTRSIPSEPTFEARVKKYEKQIPALVQKCEENVDCPKLDNSQAKFVGAQSCKGCHAAAYDVWKKAIFDVPATDEKGNPTTSKSGHSKAWATLEAKKKIEDRSCVGCHSIGFMEPGGYCKVKEVDFRANVQCESCHTAGSLHAASGDKRFIRRDVPESTCRSCHHVPHIPTTESFVYNEKVQKILGKGHGELFLARLKHQAENLVKD